MNFGLTIEKFLEKINLNNIFLGLGFLVTILSVVSQYNLGIKLGLITLVFGGIFRVLNIISSAIPRQNRKNPTFKLFIFAVIKFIPYFIFLILYLYLINQLILNFF